MRRNYARESRAGWELNAYVEEMTTKMRVELMETRRAEEAARPVRNDPDTHVSDADAAPGGPTLANPAAAPVEVDNATPSTATAQPTSTSHVMKSTQQTIDTPLVGDWSCVCCRWRRPTQAICHCGGSEYRFINFASDADTLVRSGPSPKDRVALYTGVTAPDDSDRLDDQEQLDLKEALRLSIQIEAERQSLSDLGKFQIEETLHFADERVLAETTPGGSVVMPTRTEGSALTATQPDSSVQHTASPPAGGIPLAVRPWKTRPQVPPGKLGATSSTSVEPVSTRPNIWKDMIRQVKDEKAPPYIARQLLRKKVDHTDTEIQAVEDYVRGASRQERLRYLSDGIPNVVEWSENG
jgi:hypothetical protein